MTRSGCWRSVAKREMRSWKSLPREFCARHRFAPAKSGIAAPTIHARSPPIWSIWMVAPTRLLPSPTKCSTPPSAVRPHARRAGERRAVFCATAEARDLLGLEFRGYRHFAPRLRDQRLGAPGNAQFLFTECSRACRRRNRRKSYGRLGIRCSRSVPQAAKSPVKRGAPFWPRAWAAVHWQRNCRLPRVHRASTVPGRPALLMLRTALTASDVGISPAFLSDVSRMNRCQAILVSSSNLPLTVAVEAPDALKLELQRAGQFTCIGRCNRRRRGRQGRDPLLGCRTLGTVRKFLHKAPQFIRILAVLDEAPRDLIGRGRRRCSRERRNSPVRRPCAARCRETAR